MPRRPETSSSGPATSLATGLIPGFWGSPAAISRAYRKTKSRWLPDHEKAEVDVVNGSVRRRQNGPRVAGTECLSGQGLGSRRVFLWSRSTTANLPQPFLALLVSWGSSVD